MTVLIFCELLSLSLSLSLTHTHTHIVVAFNMVLTLLIVLYADRIKSWKKRMKHL